MTRTWIVPPGDSCVTLQFDAGIDARVNARCSAIADQLDQRRHSGVRDIVPTYNGVTVHFERRAADREALHSSSPDGRPILLMNDHATTGGSAIAGTVTTADLPIAGQLAPGDSVRFVECSLAEVDEAPRLQEAQLGIA